MARFPTSASATMSNFDNTQSWWDSTYGPENWHDADYCDEPETCTLHHRHHMNCKCADCCVED